MVSTSLSRLVPVLRSATKYDAIIVGAGHNGLVTAAYLARAGKKVCVLERRPVVGGAAVTEEIIPGFKFSRASYVLGLLRPRVHDDLQLEKHGLQLLLRDPSSYTPILPQFRGTEGHPSLTLGMDKKFNSLQIAQFSQKDAENFPKYEAQLQRFAKAINYLLEFPPPLITKLFEGSLPERIQELAGLRNLFKTGRLLSGELPQFLELLTAPTSRILSQWFESEPLRATLATDSVIGAMLSPDTPGSGYVLLHHVMAAAGGIEGAWAYPVGGMGAVTEAMRRSAEALGTKIFTNEPVSSIVLDEKGSAIGVETASGTTLYAGVILSNATPHVTFRQLLPQGVLPKNYEQSLDLIDYTSPVCKINVALQKLPNFEADPNSSAEGVQPHHRCTIHLNCEQSSMIHEAYETAQRNLVPERPMIELTLPSSLDRSLAPRGCHVALLFTQYLPYTPLSGPWDDQSRNAFAKSVFNLVDEYAPGFSESIVGFEVLMPPDLEKIFGLTGGNIFHGAMSLDRLFWSRPTSLYCGPHTPVPGLLLCGAGAHPGGGVMGAPGRIAAKVALRVMGKVSKTRQLFAKRTEM